MKGGFAAFSSLLVNVSHITLKHLAVPTVSSIHAINLYISSRLCLYVILCSQTAVNINLTQCLRHFGRWQAQKNNCSVLKTREKLCE